MERDSTQEGSDATALACYQSGFMPLLFGIGAALVLTLFLKETGPTARKDPQADRLEPQTAKV